MRLILEEVIMSERHISDGQLYLFLQLFFNTQKIEDWIALKQDTCCLYSLWYHFDWNIYPSNIEYEKKNHVAWLSVVFPFDISLFWLRILKKNTKWCIKMVRTSNESTVLSIQHNMLWKIFGNLFFKYVLV